MVGEGGLGLKEEEWKEGRGSFLSEMCLGGRVSVLRAVDVVFHKEASAALAESRSQGPGATLK